LTQSPQSQSQQPPKKHSGHRNFENERVLPHREEYSKRNNKRVPSALVEKETDEKKIKNRQKQINFGKNTIGYETYLKQVPREKRTKAEPWTPDKTQKCSKRSWDGQIRKWRRQLHKFDPLHKSDEEEIVIDIFEELEEYNEDENSISDSGEIAPTPQAITRSIYDNFDEDKELIVS